jgi:hypothetical protein
MVKKVSVVPMELMNVPKINQRLVLIIKQRLRNIHHKQIFRKVLVVNMALILMHKINPLLVFLIKKQYRNIHHKKIIALVSVGNMVFKKKNPVDYLLRQHHLLNEKSLKNRHHQLVAASVLVIFEPDLKTSKKNKMKTPLNV